MSRWYEINKPMLSLLSGASPLTLKTTHISVYPFTASGGLLPLVRARVNRYPCIPSHRQYGPGSLYIQCHRNMYDRFQYRFPVFSWRYHFHFSIKKQTPGSNIPKVCHSQCGPLYIKTGTSVFQNNNCSAPTLDTTPCSSVITAPLQASLPAHLL